LEPVEEEVRVIFAGREIARTTQGLRVLETSHPPVYYVPPEDVVYGVLRPSANRSTFCEWKGQATYWDLVVDGEVSRAAAWSYPDPVPRFAGLKDHLAFYPSRVGEAFVGDERVEAQEGDFYGGWITSKVVGPFKGGAGTWGW
jgi:uncharacterized protein (DUF427 family)